MNTQTNAKELFDFIKRCPTAYQTTSTLKSILTENGFTKLEEGNSWNLVAGGKYFTTRNQSSLIAFVMPADLAKTTVCPLARVMRRELKQRGIIHLPVLYSTELPVTSGTDENGKKVPASTAFVPAAAGLMIGAYAIKTLLDNN